MMTKTADIPLVSVIIPLYNKEKYIVECLQSVYGQSIENWECIVIDDGSTDNSFDVASEFTKKDKRFRLYKQKNSGPSATRNRGIRESIGKYVEFVDADDYIDTCLLEKQLEIAHDQHVEVVVNPIAARGDEGEYSSQAIGAGSPVNIGELDSRNGFILGQLPLGPYAKLIKRSLLNNRDIEFPESTRIGEDQVFSLALYTAAKKIGVLNEALYYYTLRQDGLMSSASKYPEDVVTSLKLMEGILREARLYERWKLSFIRHFEGNINYNLSLFGEDKDAQIRILQATNKHLYSILCHDEGLGLPTVKIATRSLLGALKRSVARHLNAR